MSFLDVFALFILVVLAIAVVVIFGILGALPGRIARRRGHPQADAVAVGGWLGLLFFGVLWPLVMIWAYMKPERRVEDHPSSPKVSGGAP
jgi:uncharacterized BrkB/YihY/UPF0761 family membrane protein